jgi:hypothetical protein
MHVIEFMTGITVVAGLILFALDDAVPQRAKREAKAPPKLDGELAVKLSFR